MKHFKLSSDEIAAVNRIDPSDVPGWMGILEKIYEKSKKTDEDTKFFIAMSEALHERSKGLVVGLEKKTDL